MNNKSSFFLSSSSFSWWVKIKLKIGAQCREQFYFFWRNYKRRKEERKKEKKIEDKKHWSSQKLNVICAYKYISESIQTISYLSFLSPSSPLQIQDKHMAHLKLKKPYESQCLEKPKQKKKGFFWIAFEEKFLHFFPDFYFFFFYR